jgi:endonuclease I
MKPSFFNTLSALPLVLSLHFSALAQVPEGYYNHANHLTGDELKSALHEIIKGHKSFPYTSANTDVWDILKETDKDTANPENVILFYSGWSVNAAQEYNNGNGWTRESVWASSHGNFGTSKGAGTDVHHIRPADPSVNSARNNKDFDRGGHIYIDGDGPTECRTDADSWEPRDAVKGDVARMLFYMAVRYEGTGGEPDLELADAVNTMNLNETGKGFHGKLSALLEWHHADPVDSLERRRNDIIYSFQNNRNPFIDHPELVEKIWVPSTYTKLKEKPVKIIPNPACDFISLGGVTGEPVHGYIYSLSGYIVSEFEVPGNASVPVHHLAPGIYFLKVIMEHEVYSEKLIISRL